MTQEEELALMQKHDRACHRATIYRRLHSVAEVECRDAIEQLGDPDMADAAVRRVLGRFEQWEAEARATMTEMRRRLGRSPGNRAGTQRHVVG